MSNERQEKRNHYNYEKLYKRTNEGNKLLNFKSERKVNLGGRPFKFTDFNKLRKRLEDYFDKTPLEEWTITGLACALDCDRDTLLNYETNKQGQKGQVPQEVIRLIKKAKMLVHNAYEKDLRKKGRSGDIFALKNFGWSDKQEIETRVEGPGITIIIPEERKKEHEERIGKKPE